MRQLILYGLVGFFSNAISFLIYVLITHVGIEPKVSMTMVYLNGVILGFFGNQKWTFTYQGKAINAVFRYVLVHIIGYTLNFSILAIFVDELGYAHELVQACAIIVVASLLFVSFKYFVFNEIIRTSK